MKRRKIIGPWPLIRPRRQFGRRPDQNDVDIDPASSWFSATRLIHGKMAHVECRHRPESASQESLKLLRRLMHEAFGDPKASDYQGCGISADLQAFRQHHPGIRFTGIFGSAMLAA